MCRNCIAHNACKCWSHGYKARDRARAWKRGVQMFGGGGGSKYYEINGI